MFNTISSLTGLQITCQLYLIKLPLRRGCRGNYLYHNKLPMNICLKKKKERYSLEQTLLNEVKVSSSAGQNTSEYIKVNQNEKQALYPPNPSLTKVTFSI